MADVFILDEEIKEEVVGGDCDMKIISHYENKMKPLGWGPSFVKPQSQNILNNTNMQPRGDFWLM